MTQETTNQDNLNSDLELLDLSEVAEITKLSITTIRRYITRKENPLPAVYLSPQEIRIRKTDLKDWLQSLPDPRRDV